MIKELVVATHNLGKVEEFKVLMKDLPIEIKYLADFEPVEEPAETGRTFAANARQKAVYYAKKLHLPCIADDSGLEVQALDGAPGVRSARYAGEKASAEDNNNLLLHNMKFQVKRTCRFRCALCVVQADGRVMNEVDGTCDGMLLHEPLGENGFGYDPLFWSTELHKGMGEATMEEKNKISHRGKAIRKLVAIWRKKEMKIGITGDTHGNTQAIRKILQSTPPVDLWLHTGDYATDANLLQAATSIKTVRVRGNCDLIDDGARLDEYLELEGYKIWLTHGHRYIEHNVQADLGYWAHQLGQDIVVYGHTHVPMNEGYAGTLLVNPGSPARPRGGSVACFAVLTLQAGQEPKVEFIKL